MTVTVAWLSTTPVKSLRLHDVDELQVEMHGAVGDRQFVLTDPNGHLVNAKTVGALIQVVATSEPPFDELTMAFPDGRVVADRVRLGEQSTMLAYGHERPVRAVIGPWSEALSALTGADLRLVQPVEPGGGIDREREGGLTLLSTASLTALATAAGTATVDPRRFRMNVGLTGAESFEEETWRDRVVTVGEVRMRVHGNVGRCAITTRDPETGVADFDTLRLLRGLRGGAATTEALPFGVWGEVVQPGRVRLGDTVSVAAGS